MNNGSNRILAYKLATTIYNSNLNNITNEIYLLNSETTKSLINLATFTRSLDSSDCQKTSL